MRFTTVVTREQLNKKISDLINSDDDDGGVSLVKQSIDDLISQRLSAYQNILDGVSLEELTNFDVPLLSAQTVDEREDGVLLSYKDGKLMEEKSLNGGEF
jgi:hypothetical protein